MDMSAVGVVSRLRWAEAKHRAGRGVRPWPDGGCWLRLSLGFGRSAGMAANKEQALLQAEAEAARRGRQLEDAAAVERQLQAELLEVRRAPSALPTRAGGGGELRGAGGGSRCCRVGAGPGVGEKCEGVVHGLSGWGRWWWLR